MTTAAEHPDAPFTVLAPWYDQVMEDVDYAGWARYIEELLLQAGKRVKSVLDVACGTGSLSIILARRGFRVTGVDNSPQMLRIAQEKTGGTGQPAFIRGDFDTFSLGEQHDAAVSVFDSLNNLLTDEELLAALINIRRHLADGGPFIFDLNTIYAMKETWGTAVRVKETGGLVSVWRTAFEPPDLSRLDISVFVPESEGELFHRLDERHTERGYDPKRVQSLVKEAGFVRCDAYEHFTFSPPRRRSTRVTYLART